MTDEQALAHRMAEMPDDELLAILEHEQDFTAEALHLARQEAERRGGVTAVGQGPGEAGVGAPEAAGRWSGTRRRLDGPLAWLAPCRQRFGPHRLLRWIVCSLRCMAVALVLTAAAGVVAVVMSGEIDHVPMAGILVLYVLFLALGLLTIQAVLVILVDIERHTRAARRDLEQIAGREPT